MVELERFDWSLLVDIYKKTRNEELKKLIEAVLEINAKIWLMEVSGKNCEISDMLDYYREIAELRVKALELFKKVENLIPTGTRLKLHIWILDVKRNTKNYIMNSTKKCAIKGLLR